MLLRLHISFWLPWRTAQRPSTDSRPPKNNPCHACCRLMLAQACAPLFFLRAIRTLVAPDIISNSS